MRYVRLVWQIPVSIALLPYAAYKWWQQRNDPNTW
jgi:hypothetical protein